ncbi:MAG: GtrA family protein [Pseudomonadota bacterium]
MNLSSLLRAEIVRYGLISGVALIVDLGLLTLLTKVWGIHYLVSATCSFIAGGVVAYFLSVRFVFRYHRVRLRSLEAAMFVALGAASLAVNTAIMALMVGRAGASILAGKLAAASVTFGVNYLLRKFVLFSPRASAAGKPGDAT